MTTLAEEPFASPAKANVQDKETFPRLVADIGGTHARFALETGPGRFDVVWVLQCISYASLSDAIRDYLSRIPPELATLAKIRHAGIAIANPVDDDEIRMTNHHWAFSIEGVRRELEFDTFVVVNDFKALANAVPYLAPDQKIQVGGGSPRAHAVIGVFGAGTGLGTSALVPFADQWTAIDCEGGHVTFAPSDELEMDVLRFAWNEYRHVSAERLLSGIGIDLLYRALAHRANAPEEVLSVPEILRRGMARECEICDLTIDRFCLMLGTMAGNLAVTLGAKGGIYIGGGIVPRLGDRFFHSGFRRRFEEKGRFAAYLADIPTYVIAAEYPAFFGVSAILRNVLAGYSSPSEAVRDVCSSGSIS